MAKQNDIKKREFVEWLAIPSSIREPKTQKEFADMIKVNVATLSRWKDEPEIMEGVKEGMKKYFYYKSTEVLQGLYRKCTTDADAGSVRLFLEYIMGYVKTENVNVNMPVSEILKGLKEKEGKGDAFKLNDIEFK